MILPPDRLLTVACTTVLSVAARPHVSDVGSGGEKPALPSRAMQPKWDATKNWWDSAIRAWTTDRRVPFAMIQPQRSNEYPDK